MRIVVNGWFSGQLATGSGQYLAGLQAWLPRVSKQDEFVLICPRLHGLNAPEAGLPGWRVIAVGTPLDHQGDNLAKLWFEQVTFPRACRRLRADIALVPYWGSPWWRPCPVLVTVHDIIPLLLPLYRGGLLQRAYTALVSRTARRAAAVLTDSQASRQDIMAHLGLSPGRVHAVTLAVDQRYERVADAVRLAYVRQHYNLPDGTFWLYLGGFDARKNLSRLLEAYARLRNQREREQIPPLVVAGRTPATDSAFAPDPRPIVARLGLEAAVHFTGWVDEADKPALYTLASAAFFVSEYEGFGLPVLEAQACGCPVVTGD